MLSRLAARSLAPQWKAIATVGAIRQVRTQVHHIRLRQVVRLANDNPYMVMKKEHQTTGRGGALVRLELQHAVTGKKMLERYNTSESLEVVHLHHSPYQFLYQEGDRVHLLEPETFEAIDMDANSITGGPESLKLLQDGMNVVVQTLEGVGPLCFGLPENYSYEVEADDFKVKQTSKGVGTKTVQLAGGALRVRVPEFIKVGEWITVELPGGKYLSRGKHDAA